MSKITKEEIIKLSKLARIGLTENEVNSLEKEMSAILEYVETLKDVNVDGVIPTSQVTGLVNSCREDKIYKSAITRDELLANAPSSDNGFIKVKSVL
jgi:aspartyl-tRNA(Asn)/glutamyl-tRNA(Gln) amidotransferase subunit C